MTDRVGARRTLIAALLALTLLLAATQAWPAGARTTTSTTTTTIDPVTTLPIAPGQTAPNGGPLLVPGEADSASSSVEDTANADNTGTVVALVIAGLLVVALLLALLTYWFWRNTRPVRPTEPAAADAKAVVNG